MKPHFWVLMLCVAGGVDADPLTLTADQAVELSLTNNLSLQADNWALQAKKRSNDLVWNAFIPQVTAAAAVSKFNQPDPQLAIPQFWVASGRLTAQLNLSLALFDGIRHTALDYQSSVIEHDTAKRKLVRDTKKAFYNLLLMQENISTFEAQLETARKRYEQEKRSFETGQGSEFTMLSAQVAYENMKPTLDEMQIGLKTAELGFKLLLGVDRQTELKLTGSVDLNDAAVDLEHLIADALAHNGDLLTLRKTLEIQRNLRNAKSDLSFLPVLGFSYTADPTFQQDPLKNSVFSNVSTNWRQENGLFTISLGMSLDALLPFSSTGVELANMDNTIHQLEANLKAAAQGTEAQVAGLVMQIEKSRASVDKLSLNVDLANRAYQMAERGYQSGAYDLLQVEDADNKLRESKLAVLQEKYAYLSSLFDLEYETNQSLTVK